MKLASAHIQDFKRFTDLTITNVPAKAKLVVLVGPNGAGKTSLFEAFNYWVSIARQQYNNFDALYHAKAGRPVVTDWSQMLQKIDLQFHDTQQINPQAHSQQSIKSFYIRSAYRHEPDFTVNQLNRADDMLLDSRRPPKLIIGEARVSDNYQRIVSASVEALFNPSNQSTTAGQIVDRLIGRIREGIGRVFDDLSLDGPGRPMQDGSFFFSKGASTGYHYKNLSGGEKAAFDLLLDFIVKTEVFDDSIFCIDEPELHMHTRLQSQLLDELLRQIPTHCQLWLSTHSIGMMRRAMELHRANPDEVVFLDFGAFDFDQPTVMKPAVIDRTFWKKMFAVALDDLSELVSPKQIVFCEGRRESGGSRSTSTFDAAVYRTIFGALHPDTEFVPLGGTSELDRDALLLSTVLTQMLPSIRTWKVFDRDDRSAAEITELNASGTRVLARRDLESYLWDDEILSELAAASGRASETPALVAEKKRLIDQLPQLGKPVDDIKAIAGQMYNECKRRLQLTQCGNNATDFARITLAPLVKPNTRTYSELETAVFGSI
ncbi:AAA family ATPase [Dyella agri]|uniref:AAA family ATPase n=1 Tax=Dyella agri TaxID=1926869 RepID=A0ABW8KGA1_9GAMM